MTEKSMRTIHHPAFPDVTREVAASEVRDWTNQGWVEKDVKPVEQKSDDKK